ncbi:Dynein light chain type 1 [Handroanthus impetiginosus]|uniref:Dynein light chain n=1 Tax=Handroanthus impetiginosus TaxID=429701 RepID=A0A2G9GUF2_9LAMI|nr:Dynein light chain type 1 [Handroanthus impetiginosus]
MAEMIARNHCKNKQPLCRRKPLLPKSDKPDETTHNHRSKPSIMPLRQPQEDEVKLAALAITLNIRLRSADMPFAMQERALRHSRAVVDSADQRRPNPTILARSLKKEFDSVYVPAWHCVAGKSFGSFVTHSPGGFVYFSVDSLSFLLFKTEVHVISQSIQKS